MNKTQVLILIAIIVLVAYYFSQGNEGNKSSKKSLKKINTQPATKQVNSPLSSPTKSEIIWETPANLFPDTNPEVKMPSADQQAWFTAKHWLSDKEIDWALKQIINDLSAEQASKYKVLEATQFMFAKEALNSQNDPAANLSFPTLLSELTATQYDLVFIPVNNPEFHWSLLVYEQTTKCFWHFDTLRGVNEHYIKPLITELAKQIWQDNQPDLKQHLQTRYHLKQNNSWDCGVAVIEIAQQIMRDYPTYGRVLLYTKLDFDFVKAREDWRQKITALPFS